MLAESCAQCVDPLEDALGSLHNRVVDPLAIELKRGFSRRFCRFKRGDNALGIRKFIHRGSNGVITGVLDRATAHGLASRGAF
jgi:hypothetical protein